MCYFARVLKNEVMKQKAKSPIIMPADFQFHHEQERKLLVKRYKNNETILSQLREIPVNPSTYEFLGELFFNAAARELENDPPTEDWLRQLRNVRNDVYLMFELARAARHLGIKT
jgi:hypothetical protein